MSDKPPWVLSVIVGYLPLVIYVVYISAIFALAGKFFERRMSYRQHWLTCLIAWGVVAVISIPYYTIQNAVGFSQAWHGLAFPLFMIAAGILITSWARWKYKIEKTGWLGLGAKIMLSFAVPGGALIGIGSLMSGRFFFA